jgi:hypothetical protein
MNQPTVAQPDAPARSRRSVGVGVAAVALGLVVALAMAFLAGLSGGPTTVPRLTIDNPTDYALAIEVRPAGDPAWTSAGSVAQRSTGVVEEVVDQGEVWVFRFDSQGHTGGELQLTRAELEQSGWRVEVPHEVGTRLARKGAQPTP